MRQTASLLALAALLVGLATPACSEGVTPTCTSDAGCGTKPGTDASSTSAAP
jgi:hypothetical protein